MTSARLPTTWSVAPFCTSRRLTLKMPAPLLLAPGAVVRKTICDLFPVPAARRFVIEPSSVLMKCGAVLGMTRSARPLWKSSTDAGSDGTTTWQCGAGMLPQPSAQVSVVKPVPSLLQVASVLASLHTGVFGVHPPLRSTATVTVASRRLPSRARRQPRRAR